MSSTTSTPSQIFHLRFTRISLQGSDADQGARVQKRFKIPATGVRGRSGLETNGGGPVTTILTSPLIETYGLAPLLPVRLDKTGLRSVRSIRPSRPAPSDCESTR